MKYVTFHSSAPIHAAGDDLTPLCRQTDGHKARRVQQVIAMGPTCHRCVQLLALAEKNSPEARTRRRHLATCQALRAGRVGAIHFEAKTTDAKARMAMARVLNLEMLSLNKIHARLLGPWTEDRTLIRPALRAQKVK